VSTAKRRGNHEGSTPVKRADGRWQVHVRYRDEHGVPRRMIEREQLWLRQRSPGSAAPSRPERLGSFNERSQTRQRVAAVC
jgi:hypothetical protein